MDFDVTRKNISHYGKSVFQKFEKDRMSLVDAYKKIKSEAKFAEDKGDFLRRKQQWGKNIRKYEKQKKKEIW